MHVLDLFNDKDRNFLNGGTMAEGGMPDLNLEYQDYLKLPPMAFQSRYKMSKEAWAEKYKNLLPKPAPVDPLAGMPEAPLEEGDVIPMPARIKTATPQSGPADVIPMIKDRTNRAYEMWKQRILQANPNSVGKIKFYSKGNNIVAQIPSMAEPLGTFNIDTYKGNVLNEVDPHNFDSDWDYQDALARSGRTRSSYRPAGHNPDDTFDADVEYSRKMYKLGQQQKADRERKADHDRLATGTNEGVAEDDAGDVEQRMIAKIAKEKQRLAKLKQTDPEAYKREMAKSKTSSRVPPVSTFEGVVEGSDNITAVFSGYGNYMKGRGANVFKHYGITVLDKQYNEDEDIAEYTVSGNKAALDQARAYLERSDQFGGMILKQGMAEGSLEEVDRRGFLKGMGAAALAGVGAGSQAQTDQRYDLGNSFVTALATIDGVTYRAIQDTISKSGYMLNQRSDGTPIVNRPGEFLVIRNGKIEARPSLAPNIIRALQKAGILPDNGEMQSQTAPAVTHSSRGGTNQPAVTHSSRGGTNQPAVTYSSSGRITRNEDTTSRMKMDDYIKAAEALQDKLTQAIKQGNQELIKKLSKEREELDARGRSGMVPEAAGDAGSKHRISLTVTDPNHPMASKRQETIQKSVRVPATRADGSAITADDAVKMAVKHHKKKGYRVHSAEHLETIGEGNMQSLLASYKNLIKRAIAIIFGKKQPTNDPAAFQRMMSKIVAPADSTRYQALWQEYKNDKHYHVPTPHPFKDINNKEKMYLWANSLSQFVSDKYSDAPIETLVHLVAGLTEIAVKEALKQSRSGLDEAAQQKPRVRKYTKMRPDGSKAVRYEVLDHMGRRITGQGPEGFDDLKRAKDFYYKNYDRLASLDETADGNVTDTVKMDVPLLIRIMEFSREDAKTDMELHDVVERLIELGKTGDTLTMQDYQDAVASVSAPEQPTQSEPVMKEAGGRYWCSTDKRWKDR